MTLPLPGVPSPAAEAADRLEAAAAELAREPAIRLLGRIREIETRILLRLAAEQPARVPSVRHAPAPSQAKASAGRLLKPGEVAKRLGRGPDWVRAHIDEIGWTQIGRRKAVTERQLEKYLQSRVNPL